MVAQENTNPAEQFYNISLKVTMYFDVFLYFTSAVLSVIALEIMR